MFVAELHQLGQTGHCAVVMQDLAKHACRLQSGEPGKIDRRLGVSRAAQHTAVFGAQRTSVARLIKIVGGGNGIGNCANGRGPVLRADPGCDSAGRVHRDGKISAIHFAVVRDHALETKLLGPLV